MVPTTASPQEPHASEPQLPDTPFLHSPGDQELIDLEAVPPQFKIVSSFFTLSRHQPRVVLMGKFQALKARAHGNGHFPASSTSLWVVFSLRVDSPTGPQLLGCVREPLTHPRGTTRVKEPL